MKSKKKDAQLNSKGQSNGVDLPTIVAELLWKHGAAALKPSNLLRKNILAEQITPGVMSQAETINRLRWEGLLEQWNEEPDRPFDVVDLSFGAAIKKETKPSPLYTPSRALYGTTVSSFVKWSVSEYWEEEEILQFLDRKNVQVDETQLVKLIETSKESKKQKKLSIKFADELAGRLYEDKQRLEIF